ncbi:MAG TPA: DUF4908 domain-containing protein [Phenylobacterium sp.]|jgi:hypothetical protein
MTAKPAAFLRASSTGVRAAGRLASVAVLALAATAARPALAGSPESLRDALFPPHIQGADGRQATAPPVARYISEDGDVFILDLSQPRPMLKFDNSFEVWTLKPQPGPRGDIIYKNDLGEPVLRATRLGGVTVFTDDHPGGEAAAMAGAGSPLRLMLLGPQALAEKLLQASARASRAARRLIPFEAEASPASSAVIADAAMVTSEAVVRMAHRADARRLLEKIMKVRLVAGRKAQAQIDAGVLEVTVNPPQGLAGRPSSERIIQVAETGR